MRSAAATSGARGPRLPSGHSLARLGATLLMIATLGANPAAAAPRDLRATRIDGRTVAYRVLGHGAPVLVLLSGLGDGMDSFKAVAPDLAQNATVILYDRAGYGDSDGPTAPRDARAVNDELVAVLEASGVRGPYVIAGHSLGGLYAEYFAARHPEALAGLILEESRPADFTRRCEAAKLGGCVVTPAMARFLPKGTRAEVAGLPDTLAQVAAITGQTDKPVLILSRAVGPRVTPFEAVWAKAQDDLAARYPGSRHLTAPAGGHYIHRDQDAWFIDRVRDFLLKTR